jgi:xanthine dehydrogenase YagT iron-sulfur-binding subunit
LTRRDFLKGASVAVSGGLLVGERVAEASPSPTAGVLGPGPVAVTLRINGKAHKLNLEPRVTLLDTLRNHLDLTGAKKVCDRATCGACTVILDGKPVYSCTVLAVEAQGHDITTCKAFLDAHPNPTLDDVKRGLGGNLCRCGTYMGVKEAVLDAAKRLKGGAAHGEM